MSEKLEGITRRTVLNLGLAPVASALAEFMQPIQAEARTHPRFSPTNTSIDYSLNMRYALPRERTRRRVKTEYLILHTTEGEFLGSLRKIRRHAQANFLIDRDGVVYQIVHPDYWANHAGNSRWDGKENLSDISIGIENVGYHYAPLTERQYSSLRSLVKYLQRKYKISDENVLAHFQVAYAVNRWTGGRKARGRKKDAINIDWRKLGIRHRTDDPDVRAGSVKPDQFLVAILEREVRTQEDPMARVRRVYGATSSPNVIGNGKTAWSLAGDEYDQPTTFYVFPNKEIKPGDKIADWELIPAGTRVYLNTNLHAVLQTLEPIITIKRGETVWQKIQAAYRDRGTYYISSDGKYVVNGDHVDVQRITPGTRIVLGVKALHKVGPNNSPKRIEKNLYNTEKAVYIFPDGKTILGNKVRDFRNIPKDTYMILKS